MTNCKYCNKEVKPLGKSMHERYCNDNPNKLQKGHGGRKKGSIPWNKGLNTSEDVKIKISNSLKGKAMGKASSKEKEDLRRAKISSTMKSNPNAGGLREGSGRGIKGRYKGYWCDSTWELAWVIYHIENMIEFKRNTQGFEYEYQGKIRKYYPDFIIENTYYEIKGRRSYKDLDEQTKTKINSFKDNLVVLYKGEMKEILDYVIEKYGNDFHKLYE